MFIDVAIAIAHTLAKLSRNKVFVVNLLAVSFGEQKIKGFKEKGE